MNEHGVSGMCAYIEDFNEWYSKSKSATDSVEFVEDRFSKCPNDKKVEISKIFDKLITKISSEGKLNLDNNDIAVELLKIIS